MNWMYISINADWLCMNMYSVRLDWKNWIILADAMKFETHFVASMWLLTKNVVKTNCIGGCVFSIWCDYVASWRFAVKNNYFVGYVFNCLTYLVHIAEHRTHVKRTSEYGIYLSSNSMRLPHGRASYKYWRMCLQHYMYIYIYIYVYVSLSAKLYKSKTCIKNNSNKCK